MASASLVFCVIEHGPGGSNETTHRSAYQALAARAGSPQPPPCGGAWTQPMTKILPVLLALATMTGAASAQSQNEIGTCGGILHRDKSRLFVGDPKTETAEDLPCFVREADVKRVLSVCAVGRWCELAGVIDGNCEPGKCEFSKVTSVSRKKPR